MLYIFDQNEQLQTILKPDSKNRRSISQDYTQNATMFTGGAETITEYGSCPYKEAPHTEQLNKEHTFQFWVPAEHPDSQFIKEENLVAFKDEDGDIRLFVIKELEEVHDDVLYKEAFCQAAWIDELNDEPIEDIRPQDKTSDYALGQILTGKRWQKGNVANLGLNSTNFYYESTVSGIQKILNTWGGEIKDRITVTDGKITGRYLDILTRRGADTGKRFEITKDIISLKRTVLSYPKTALYGRGKGEQVGDGYGRRITFADVVWTTSNGDPVNKPAGQEWVGDPEALVQFGRPNDDGSKRHRFGFFDSSDEEDPGVLLLNTWNDLQVKKKPIMRYDLKVIDLEHVAGFEHEKVRLGDTVFCIDRFFSPAILIEARVIEIKRYRNEPERTEIKLGNFLPLFTDSSRLDRVEAKLNDKTGIWDTVTDPIDDTDFPDIIPPIPTGFTASAGFKTIMLKWDYFSASYIAAYEVHGSQVNNFTPDISNLLWRGNAGGYAHNADVNQQWYFRIRAVNTHGTVSMFSDETSASTARIQTDDIMFGAVTSDLLEDLTITAEKLASGSITEDKLTNASVTMDKIADNAVTSKKVAENAIKSVHIEAGVISEEKMKWTTHLLF